jgi:hypothetical protein
MSRLASNLALRLAFPLLLAICAACAHQQKGAGALTITPLYNPGRILVYLGVEGSHLFAHGPDAQGAPFDLEVQQDGCTRGYVYPDSIEVCPVPNQSDPSRTVRAWVMKGPFGTRTFTIDSRGDTVFVDFGLNLGRVQFVLPSEGVVHDHPEMLAAAFLEGAFGRLRPGSETQAYLIERRQG